MISLLSKICITILAFPCQQHTFRLFSSNSLDRSLGLCREMIEQQNTGYITCVFTLSPTLCLLQPPSKKKKKQILAVSMSAALGVQKWTGIRWEDQKAVCV